MSFFVEIVFPEMFGPLDRQAQFEDPLDTALQAAGLGEVTGGGTGRGASNIDVELVEVSRGIELIREVLSAGGAPQGTVIIQREPAEVRYPLYVAAEP